MIIPILPHQNNIQQIGYKLLPLLDFKGKKGEEVAKPSSQRVYGTIQ